MRSSTKADPERQGTLPLSPADMMVEKGTTGLNEWGGYVSEEFLRDLQGRQGYEKYREMQMNSAMVGAVLFAIENILLQPDWYVEAGEGPDAEEAREFVEQCLQDMEYTWRDTVSESLSFLPFGFSLMEIVLKERRGPFPGFTVDGWPLPPSEFADKKLGWHKLAIRGQETIDRWKRGPGGEIVAVVQQDPNTGATMTIPRSKLLHFKTTSTQRNPEGRSILRTAYRSYHYMTRLEEIEAIGHERNATGLPTLTPPLGVDLFNITDAKMRAQLAYAKKVVTGIRRDALMGVVKPYGWVLELLRAPGSDPMDIGKTIERYSWNIARCVLAQFLEQGRQVTGSYAAKLGDISLFLRACRGWHTLMVQELQRRAVTPLVTIYNDFRLTKPPQLKVHDVTEQELVEVAETIQKLTAAAWLTPDRQGEAVLRERLHLPAQAEEEETPTPPAEPHEELPGAAEGQEEGEGREGQRTEEPVPAAAGQTPGQRQPAAKSLHELIGVG